MSMLLVVATWLLSQAPAPDLTGSWKMVADRSGSPTQSTPIVDMTFVIEQDPTEVRVEMLTAGGKPVSVTYPVVPAPKPPAEPLAGGQPRAYWEGNRLILERGGTISGQTVSSKQTLTLSPDRSELTVERIVIVQHGYTLKGTPNYATVKDVFVRAQH
jgi:hypothetical protein